MTYRLDMDAEVRTYLTHLSPIRKRKVKASMKAIAVDPHIGKALQQNLSGLCSYRIGTLRIIYTIDRLRWIVHVVALGPRSTIYEEVEREMFPRCLPR